MPRHCSIFIGAVLATSLVHAVQGGSECDPYYDIAIAVGQDCGIFGTAGITLTALSEEGIATGYMSGCADAGAYRGVIWDSTGTVTVFTSPAGTHSVRPYAISNGILAGHAVSNGNKGFFYSMATGQWTLIGPPKGGNYIEFFGVNAHAEAVGRWYDAVDGIPPETAARWTEQTRIDLALPIGPNSEAVDISDTGTIVGWMGQFPAPQFGSSVAFMYKDRVGIALDMPKGAISSDASHVNNNDLIAGRCWFPHPSGAGYILRAVTWHVDGSVTLLPLLPGYDSSRVSCMDDHGQVFGSCFIEGSNQAVAVVWHDGEVRPFTFQYEPVPGLVSFGARLCNNAGQRAGGGLMQDGTQFINVGVLLTPRPPILGDTNCDRIVGIADLLGVLSEWGSADSSADLNDDETVDLADLMIVINNWGNSG